MPEVVKTDSPDAGSLHDPLEHLAERMRVDGGPVLQTGDEILILVVGLPLRPLVLLSPTVVAE